MKKMISILVAMVNVCFAMAACSSDDDMEQTSAQEQTSGQKINVDVNGHSLTATLVDNSSSRALIALLQKGNITVDAHDYGGFEKVGNLPQSLPQNNTQITTSAGDIILYVGRSICFYYSRNSYNFTRLGRIDNAENLDLKAIYGNGDATFVLSLPTAASIDTPATSAKVKRSIYTTNGQLLAGDTSPGTLPHGLYIVRETDAKGNVSSRKIKL